VTEADWRRTHADPEAVRRAARDLRERAGRLVEPFERLHNEVERSHWRGVVATRFRNEARDRYERVRRARSALDSAAQSLEREAQRLQDDLERVRREERMPGRR
jgi:uncharacterized protein YukE